MLKPGIETEAVPSAGGTHRLYYWKGFDIKTKENVMYSKNPITTIKQEFSAIFKRKEYPPTEFSWVITRVPNEVFKDLLNKCERIEYPTNLPKEQKQKLRDVVLNHVWGVIGDRIIPFLKKYQTKNEESTLPLIKKKLEINHNGDKIDITRQTKICPQCRISLHKETIKCKNCGNWIDNDVFKRLSDNDVKLIKSKDLIPITPHYISLMLLEPLSKELLQMLDESEQSQIELGEAIFYSYCYVATLNLKATKKTGKEKKIEEDLNIELISLVLSIFKEMFPNQELNHKDAIKFGLYLYRQLNKLHLQTFYRQDDEASMVIYAKRIGDIIYKEKYHLTKSLNLYVHLIMSFKHFGEPFSELFIIEEEDFKLQSG